MTPQTTNLLYAMGAIVLIAVAYEINRTVGLSLAGLALLAMVTLI